jgi:hypothetical protein
VSDEVAERLHQPLDDVRAEIAEAITKLGARSKLEAILIALQSHEIEPNSAYDAWCPSVLSRTDMGTSGGGHAFASDARQN